MNISRIRRRLASCLRRFTYHFSAPPAERPLFEFTGRLAYDWDAGANQILIFAVMKSNGIRPAEGSAHSIDSGFIYGGEDCFSPKELQDLRKEHQRIVHDYNLTSHSSQALTVQQCDTALDAIHQDCQQRKALNYTSADTAGALLHRSAVPDTSGAFHPSRRQIEKAHRELTL